jgi:hypothetical protein
MFFSTAGQGDFVKEDAVDCFEDPFAAKSSGLASGS